jgi:hypothetical protein
MTNCRSCSNRGICTLNESADCDHYDVAFTRSEIINIFMKTKASDRSKLQEAVTRAYKVKMAF